jgi:choline dehydrogenase-like flavoprotein
VRAKHVVVAAGAIHSPLLLQQSGLRSAAWGQHLSLQPQAAVTGVVDEEVRPFLGIPQSAWCDEFERADASQGLSGFRMEGISGTPGVAASLLPAWGPRAAELMRSWRRSIGMLCLVPDQPAGRVQAGPDGRPRISYPFTPEWTRVLEQAIRAGARLAFAAGARAVTLPLAGAPLVESEAELERRELRLEPGRVQLLSAHPQGTCRAGPDPARSALGLDFRVHGLPNLQVLDASVFPTSASSHTMLPIMTIAWLGARAAIRG